jgi:hypothetical protein
MKKLLLIWIFSGCLDGIGQDKNDTIAIATGTYLVRHKDSLIGFYRTPQTTDTTPIYCGTAGVTLITYRTDTLRSVLLVTGKPPAFTHAVYGYCVVRNGVHVGHLDSRGRLFKLPVRVWGCEGIYPKK